MRALTPKDRSDTPPRNPVDYESQGEPGDDNGMAGVRVGMVRVLVECEETLGAFSDVIEKV